MGKRPAVHVDQRESGISSMYANAIFDYHWPSIVKKLPNDLLMAIAEMQEGRSQKCGPLSEQLRPMSIVSYQDDHIIIFMSNILAELYDSLFFTAVEETLEWEIPMYDISTKQKADMPYDVRHEALGLSIDG